MHPDATSALLTQQGPRDPICVSLHSGDYRCDHPEQCHYEKRCWSTWKRHCYCLCFWIIRQEFVYLSHYGKNSKQVATSCVASSMEELQDRTIKVKVLNKLASARASGASSGSRVLTDLVEGLEEAAIAVELRLKINQSHPDLKGGSSRDYGEAVLKHLENSIDLDPKLQKAPVNYEGVWVSGFGGWFLLRLLLYDLVLPLNIEAPTHDDTVKLGLAVLGAVKEFAALDTSALDKFVQVS